MTYCLNPDCPQPQNPETNKLCQGCGFNLRLKERYLAINLMGQGGFGRTFLAIDQHPSTSSPCVIKQLLPQWLASFNLQKAKALFEQEAILLKELGNHPQIPSLLDYFTQNQYFYLVQEFIDGSNLAQLVDEDGTFNELQIWQLLDDLLPVIEFIHNHQIIHRDIKPKNIIRHPPLTPYSPLSLSGELVLVDFGAAKVVKGMGTLELGTSIGSPEYVAPEQARGKAVFASDLYSLGVTCIYLLTGISPFELFDVINNSWVWQDYLTQEVSINLIQILDKLIQNTINSRFQSANDVMEAINRVRGRGRFQRQPFDKKDNPITNSNSILWQCRYTLNHNLGVNSVAISPNGNTLASGSDDKTIGLWDLNRGKVISILTGHSQAVNSVAFSPDGTQLASGSDDQTIKVWNWQNKEEIYTLSGHSHKVKSVAFSPDGKLLASGSWDKTVKLWDVQTGELMGAIASHNLQVSSVAFSPCGNFLASASFDRTVRLWNLSTKPNSELFFELNKNFIGHAWAVFAVAFSADGKIIASGSDDKTIQLWDLETGQLLRTILGHSWSVVALGFRADTQILVSGSWDKTIKLWQVNTGEEIATLIGHLDSISAVAIHPNRPVIASGSKDKTVKLWYQSKE
ncbi:MAG TPA: serine/threonine protein kinase [Cyanobacteria bacterium UBA12227]|nr:serine/threonine protein kinase [Cyanobacteria bacterium UBA12227]HAX88149.1 serine/threonine protein kinase [Cyanobacteria bacterium UBA11370]HBY76307.1 serine/threonine protein kinase [Cyanobacteria bacterium UBA11148]